MKLGLKKKSTTTVQQFQDTIKRIKSNPIKPNPLTTKLASANKSIKKKS